MAGRSDQLTPFDTERAREAGRKSGQVRRARALAQRAQQNNDARTAAQHLATFTQEFDRDSLGENSAAVGNWILSQLASGKIPIRHAADAAELLKVLHDMTRLEEGASTSNILHGTIDSSAILARITELRDELTTPALPPSDGTGTQDVG